MPLCHFPFNPSNVGASTQFTRAHTLPSGTLTQQNITMEITIFHVQIIQTLEFSIVMLGYRKAEPDENII